ncbi:hypothetical protein [Aquabacterium humicola]|uniref:hypothetical protein n=1 Tax=Aquabacterium humicola TaxID=3237377 RepID=UPI0025431979|nr:hypothetical protein [Rubrivivax pictus]
MSLIGCTTPLRLLAALAASTCPVLCAAAATAASSPPSAAAPTALEAEYWRSAERVGTADAYQAYLARFPEGFFAPLARAALAKTKQDGAAPGNAQATATDGLPPGAGPDVQPARIAAAAPSGAVSFAIGDVFQGPGSITVGWLGVKKQLVVPPGKWVVLAAEDSRSTHTRPVHLTTVVLGRFEGSTLRTTLEAIFNSRPGGGGTWTDMLKCEANEPVAAFQLRRTFANVNVCLQLRASKPNPSAGWTGAWAAARTNIHALGARLNEAEGLATRVILQDNVFNYMRVSRFDWGGWTDAAAASSTPPLNVLQDRSAWAVTYAGFASKGLGKNLATEDLVPGGGGAPYGLPIPD